VSYVEVIEHCEQNNSRMGLTAGDLVLYLRQEQLRADGSAATSGYGLLCVCVVGGIPIPFYKSA